MSVLRLGNDEYIDENKPFARMEIYVLLRSFEARDDHLREMEKFRAQLPGENVIQFLPDPLSDMVPSYHAAMPYEVKTWVRTRQEVVDVRRFRNTNGLDQYDDPEAVYVPDRYTIWFRNHEQLEKHIEELEQFCAAREPAPPALNILMTLGGGCNFMVSLPEDVLEWVKGRDEVITVARDQLMELCDLAPQPEPLKGKEDAVNLPRELKDTFAELSGIQFSER